MSAVLDLPLPPGHPTSVLAGVRAALGAADPVDGLSGAELGVAVRETAKVKAQLAAYELRIELSPAYAAVEPRAWETGGAFPHDTDHHVFDNGRCCLLVWEHWLATAGDISLRAFFDGPLRNYFLGQYAVAQGLGRCAP